MRIKTIHCCLLFLQICGKFVLSISQGNAARYGGKCYTYFVLKNFMRFTVVKNVTIG